MRKWWVVLMIIMVLAQAVPVAAQDATPAPEIDLTAICRTAVDGIETLTADLGWPEHLMQENATKTEDDFDVNAYFDVLDHLSVQEGYFLDYVYAFDFLGSNPVLYTLPESEEPYATFADYDAVAGNNPYPNYRTRIVIDDTPEGYLQMVILDVMGEQFYLGWHANYNDTQIICDQESLNTLLTSKNDFDQFLPEDVQAQASELDVTPTVELVDDEHEARVQVVAFTKWGGFYRVTFTIDRHFPRFIYGTHSDQLVAYDCGVMF